MYQELAQFNNWLKCQYPNSSVSVHYSSDLALFFSFVKKPPSGAAPQDVDSYVSHVLQQGQKPSTINRRLSALRTFYYFLSMTCDQPPACPVLTKHRLRKSYPLPRDVSNPDIKTLFAQIDNTRDKAMFILMLDCGLRVGEVHNLSLKDLHFENPSHILVHGKGGKQRIVYLSPPSTEALQGWLSSRPVSKDRAVFISEHGERLSVSGIQYLLREYCKKTGIHFTCHQLRHTFGRRMAEANLPLTSLQSLLGHKNVRTTQIYVHLSDPHLQSAYDHAISQIATPLVPNSKAKHVERQYLQKTRQINWQGYLDGFPDWLADSMRAFCLQPSQTKDTIQHTRNVLSRLSHFAGSALSHILISSLADMTPRVWFSFVEARLQGKIKPASLNAALRTLQSFLKFACESGYPICERMLEVRPLKTPDSLSRDLTLTQLNLLLAQAGLHDYAWILLMSQSGLRTCEARDLRWQDVDLQRRTIRVEESKGLRSRIVFLSQPMIYALKHLPKIPEYVFTYNDRPLSNRYCQSRLKTLGRKCGVQVTPHQLRHTAATMLLNAGMSIFAVQTLLDHKYVDTTLKYARAYDATVEKDYQQAIKMLEENTSTKSLV